MEAMDNIELRRALQAVVFQLMQDLAWYKKRKTKENKALNKYFLHNWILCIAPFMPHLAEELWHNIGNKDSVFKASLPKELELSIEAEQAEELIRDILEDVNEIKKLANIEKPKKIVLYTASPWKYRLFELLKENLSEPNANAAIKIAMQDSEIKTKGKLAIAITKQLASRIIEWKNKKTLDEFAILNEAKPFLEKTFNCEVIIEKEESATYDPKDKAKNALPFKPAIYME